jgi:hypothetical protein
VRLPGWRKRLDDLIEEIRRRPFDWKNADCAIAFGARAVEAINGKDLAAPYRGEYKNSNEAFAVMKKAGFKRLDDMVASLLPEIPVSFAQVGDIVTFPKKDRFKATIGVVNGERVFVVTEEGLGTLELTQAKRAFKVD